MWHIYCLTHSAVGEANAKVADKGDGWFWQKFYSVRRTWPDTTCRSDFKTRHLRHAQTAKLWHHLRPTRQEIHGWRKSTPKEKKKKRKHNTKRNARKRQHLFYFLCYFSTASASVTSCFFSTSDLWIVAAASVNCLPIVNCPSFGSWRHLEPPHSAPPINMKTNFGHNFLWRRWWRGLLNLTFHVSSCFALFSYSLMTNVSVLLMRRAEKIKPHLIATRRLMTLVLIYDQKSWWSI